MCTLQKLKITVAAMTMKRCFQLSQVRFLGKQNLRGRLECWSLLGGVLGTIPIEEGEETGLTEGKVGCHGVSVETQTILQGVLKVDSSLLLSQLGARWPGIYSWAWSVIGCVAWARLSSAEAIPKGAQPWCLSFEKSRCKVPISISTYLASTPIPESSQQSS